MINPNNAIGTNGAFGGRTSVNAFNDDLASYSTGILSGWACEPSSGLTVILGGDGNTRDVAIAEDNAGNKTTINNISGSPVSVTIGAAPNSNSRIDSIVAYVNNPPTGTSTATDNYGACGLIVVAGTVSSTPSAPSESAIRAAITADGASGTTAYYVVLANITIPSGTTDLTSNNISQGSIAKIGSNNMDFTTVKILLSDADNITSVRRTVASYTITEKGKYLIFLNADLNLLGRNIGNGNVSIDLNNDKAQEVYFNNNAQDYFIGGLQLMTIEECNVGDVITVTADCQQQSYSINIEEKRSNLRIIKIG